MKCIPFLSAALISYCINAEPLKQMTYNIGAEKEPKNLYTSVKSISEN